MCVMCSETNLRICFTLSLKCNQEVLVNHSEAAGPAVGGGKHQAHSGWHTASTLVASSDMTMEPSKHYIPTTMGIIIDHTDPGRHHDPARSGTN